MTKPAGNTAPHLSERALWAEAMRDVTPLRGRSAPVTPQAPRHLDAPATEAENARGLADPHPPERFAGIDRASAERLKRGLHPIEARLDLHGLTQAEAHRELLDFVERSYRSGIRCVLVITGRGLGPDGPGVLKTAVPRWLAQPATRRRILAIAAAQPRHGGAGALYVLLRRQR